jgi:proteasome lid subunit RPN8/RPN11
MLAQARAEYPNECCGFLAGRIDADVGRVSQRYPLINEAASGREYEASGPSLFAAHRDMRQEGTDVLAIYHSHPTSAPVPSRTDLARNYWPGVVCVIVSLAQGDPEVRAWWLLEDTYQEADWAVIV